MAGVERTEIRPAPGEPWTAAQVNAVVDQSVLYRDAFIGEHGNAGEHQGERFAVAAGIFQRVGGIWSTVKVQGMTLIAGDAGRVLIELDRPMLDDSWGCIGEDGQGQSVMNTIPTGTTEATVYFDGSATLVTLIAVGPRAPL